MEADSVCPKVEPVPSVSAAAPDGARNEARSALAVLGGALADE